MIDDPYRTNPQPITETPVDTGDACVPEYLLARYRKEELPLIVERLRRRILERMKVSRT